MSDAVRPTKGTVPAPPDATAKPDTQQPRSVLPLGFGRRADIGSTLPPYRTEDAIPLGEAQVTIGASSTTDVSPPPLREQDHDLIDYLIKKALEKCAPCRSEYSRSLAEQNKRSAKRRT
jgi:hypothetical protein